MNFLYQLWKTARAVAIGIGVAFAMMIQRRNSNGMQYGMYWTTEILTGSSPTRQEVERRFQALNRDTTIMALAAIGQALGFWKGPQADSEIYGQLLRGMFPEIWRHLLGNTDAHMFSRRQLMTGMRLAAQRSNVAGGYRTNDGYEFYGRLGEALLGTNDLLQYGLAGRTQNERKRWQNLFVELNPVADDTGSTVMATAARSFVLLREVAPALRTHRRFIDIDLEFQQATGVSVTEFHAIAYGLLAKWITFTKEEMKTNPSQVLLHRDFFRTSAARPAAVEIVLSLLSMTPESLALAAQNRRLDDFTPFRAKPLLQLPNDRYLAFDLKSLAAALEAFPYWTVQRRRPGLQEFWGEIFECYAEELVRNCCDPRKNSFLFRPLFTGTNEEFADITIKCGRSLLAIEIKGGMLPVEAKYSGSPAKCFREIHKKFVRNERGEPKGVTQLSNNLERAFVQREGVDGLPAGQVKEVIPILVIADQVGDNPIFTRVMNYYFQSDSLSRRSGIQIHPVIGMSIDGLEHLVASGKRKRLPKLASDWIKEYMASPVPMPAWIGKERNKYLKQKLQAATDDTVRLLFNVDRQT